MTSIGEERRYIPYRVYSATKSYIEINPEIIKGFTNATYKSILWVNNIVLKKYQKLYKMLPRCRKEILVALVERFREQGTWKPDPVLTEDGLTHMFEIMEGAGQLDKRDPYDKIITTEFVEKVFKEEKLK